MQSRYILVASEAKPANTGLSGYCLEGLGQVDWCVNARTKVFWSHTDKIFPL